MTFERLTVPEFIEHVQEAYANWSYFVESLPQSRLVLPGVAGNWSLKDIIAHIRWHEAQMVEVMEARALVGSDWWLLTTDERNACIYEKFRNMPLQDVLGEAKTVHQQLIGWISKLTDKDLNEPKQFADMSPDWLFGDILAQNTYEHYQAHRESACAWVAC